MAGVNPVLAGLACRCPSCGKGPVFRGYLQVCETCAACGFDLRKADAGDGPAVFIILGVGALACLAAGLTEAAFHPPVWVHLLIWPLAAVAGALALLRPFKAVLLAMQFHHRASEARHER